MNTNAPRTVTTPIMEDDTRHCPMCEDAAKKILELEQRVKVLTNAVIAAAEDGYLYHGPDGLEMLSFSGFAGLCIATYGHQKLIRTMSMRMWIR